MQPSIDNGRRAQVRFGTYSGPAGVSSFGDVTEVAFFAEPRPLEAVRSGTIDGESYRVITLARSEHVKGMVVLAVLPG